MRDWPLVPLGEVLHQSIDRHPVEAGRLYPNIGIYGFGRGVFDKPPIDGGSFAAESLYRIRAGQFIYSRLKAFEGAYGLVPDFGDGAFVTNEFPSFDIDTRRVLPRFLCWFFRCPSTWEQLGKHSAGVGARRERLHPNALLSEALPLPPLAEQERIAERLDAVAMRLAEVQKLRREIQTDIEALLVAMAHRNDLSPVEKLAAGWRQVSLGQYAQQVVDDVPVTPGQTYRHFGIYSFTNGLFHKPDLSGDELQATRLYRVSEGQFIYGRLNAYEGAFGIVTKPFDGAHVSSEFPAFVCDQNHVLPEFLLAYFSTPAVWEDLKRQVTGIGGGAGNRRIRLKEGAFLAYRVWLPPIRYQQAIQLVAHKLTEVKAMRERTTAEFSALLPAVLDRAFKGEL